MQDYIDLYKNGYAPETAPNDGFAQVIDNFKSGLTAMTIHHIGSSAQMMELFVEFGAMRGAKPDAPEAQAQVKKLQEYITAHYYQCTDEILAGLGQMYTADEAFRENIDKAGGEGTAAFAGRAIACHCRRK